ncbi:MFS general substrate transporter [Mytilinidion resinicola]|uniref:MFS general substrate transporter n=1 Tax=Mytilinidion resinicola TaxID=574789 RepID=A0A6A6YSF5_9PEZI|nr:MFS general substrate transporter [Mytilinidion resinicola]KAF2811303.1 MFS general substrate transporter [Mytilinidion resinicola]
MAAITALGEFGLATPTGDKAHPTVETTAVGSGGVLTSSEFDNEPKKLEAYQKPGAWGAICRFGRTVQRYVWDDPDKSTEEKKFLFKLDFFTLIYCCLGYFCKGLAQTNIFNAYVSGMKESLNMQGSELTYMQNVFTAGYVVGQLPAVMLATRVRPSILVPTCEVLWAVCTFASATVTTVPQLYALRFLIGLFESAYFPCIIYVMGSWYTKHERAKRLTLFYASGSMAGMFSGYLQAGAYKGLNGKLGHEGWQWLFIICGIISLPSGLLGYVFLADFPETTRAFYITKAEAEWARERLRREGYKPLGASKWTRTKVFRIMAQWQFWVLPIGYMIIQQSVPQIQPIFSLWLKAEKYSVYDINVLPTAQTAIGVVVQLIAGMVSDSPLLKGRRAEAMSAMILGTFFSVITLAVWDVSHDLRFAAYYLAYTGSGLAGLYFSWFPELIPHDHEMRGFMIAVSNMFSYIQSIWISDVVWRTADAPRFHRGFIAASVFCAALVLLTILLRVLELRDVRKRARLAQGDEEGPAAAATTSEATETTHTLETGTSREGTEKQHLG